MRNLVTIAAPILVFTAGCGGRTPPADSNVDPQPTTATQNGSNSITNLPSEEKAMATPIPNDVTYTIIDENTIPDTKRSLDIRLNKKVPEEVLRSIAIKLKNSDLNSYERIFIGYYLPDMEINAGYWATTHFNPDLEVRVLGLTAEQEQTLTQQTNDASREVVGSWLDERPFVGHRITIYRKDGKLFMENTFKDGSSGTEELQEHESPLGRRFNKVGESTAGDHWILDSNGNLQLRDDEGLISTAKKIE